MNLTPERARRILERERATLRDLLHSGESGPGSAAHTEPEDAPTRAFSRGRETMKRRNGDPLWLTVLGLLLLLVAAILA